MNQMRIKEFNDIQIFMDVQDKINDFSYPHLTIKYKGLNAKVSLDLKMIQGRLPVDITLYILDWTARHEKELITKWNVLCNKIKKGIAA